MNVGGRVPFDVVMEDRIARITEACTLCGKCIEACSMVPYTDLKGADPEAVARAVVDLINGRPHAPEGARWAEICQKSGICIEACPEDVNPREMLFYAKTKLGWAREGREALARKSRDFFQRLGRTIKILSGIQTEPGLFRRLTAVREGKNERADAVFYFGCHILKTPHILLSCMDVFERMGLDYEIAGGLAHCCGINHFRGGDPAAGAALGAKSLAKIASFRPERVITFCPTCQMQYTEYRSLYPGPREEELPFVHVTQYLAENLEKLRTLCVYPVAMRVALHIHRGGPPRLEENAKAILGCVPGLELVDIDQHMDHGYQCPTLLLPGAPEAMRAKLFSSAREAGVDAVLTIYHSCQYELCREEKNHPFAIENFMTVLGRAMGFEYPDRTKAYALYEDLHQVLADAGDMLRANGIDPERARGALKAAFFG